MVAKGFWRVDLAWGTGRVMMGHLKLDDGSFPCEESVVWLQDTRAVAHPDKRVPLATITIVVVISGIATAAEIAQESKLLAHHTSTLTMILK